MGKAFALVSKKKKKSAGGSSGWSSTIGTTDIGMPI
jgi:hypothetical protein